MYTGRSSCSPLLNYSNNNNKKNKSLKGKTIKKTGWGKKIQLYTTRNKLMNTRSQTSEIELQVKDNNKFYSLDPCVDFYPPISSSPFNLLLPAPILDQKERKKRRKEKERRMAR